jgi:hypothetical protein
VYPQTLVDSSGVTTLLDRLTSVRADLLDTIADLMLAASYVAPLDAADTRAALGLADADLDTQLAALSTFDPATDAVIIAVDGLDDLAIATSAETEIRDIVDAALADAEVEANLTQIAGYTITGDGTVTPFVVA